ncbi:hypothetical protein [Pseudovibrio japonicus]|uniref:hypothetical protein n=1 Tax=Pseudovibrio japonicus TaxID=366534 RepID=UPI001676C021|nr:hypothetical protein [Pseudovibrio japonicus]
MKYEMAGSPYLMHVSDRPCPDKLKRILGDGRAEERAGTEAFADICAFFRNTPLRITASEDEKLQGKVSVLVEVPDHLTHKMSVELFVQVQKTIFDTVLSYPPFRELNGLIGRALNDHTIAEANQLLASFERQARARRSGEFWEALALALGIDPAIVPVNDQATRRTSL